MLSVKSVFLKFCIERIVNDLHIKYKESNPPSTQVFRLVRPLQLYDLFDWMILYNKQYIKPRGILKKIYKASYMKPIFWKPSTVPNKNFSEKASKGMFLKPEKLQNHSNEGKGKEKKKEWGEGKEEKKKKKAMVALLVFIIATLEIVFGWKKLFDAKGPLGDNNIKNLARYTYM